MLVREGDERLNVGMSNRKGESALFGRKGYCALSSSSTFSLCRRLQTASARAATGAGASAEGPRKAAGELTSKRGEIFRGMRSVSPQLLSLANQLIEVTQSSKFAFLPAGFETREIRKF